MQLLVTAGDNPERLKSSAAFAHLCGVAPVPASSGRTTRHRLNRGDVERHANAALYRITLCRLDTTTPPAPTGPDVQPNRNPPKTSSAASSATSSARSTKPSEQTSTSALDLHRSIPWNSPSVHARPYAVVPA
ncbi:transposase [Candidatus Microthrix parvicella]|uniref:transposase n=1 Tax=Candidatus Neomicrothrix parvicella TaxID=41950 RepID=UPI003B968A69